MTVLVLCEIVSKMVILCVILAVIDNQPVPLFQYEDVLVCCKQTSLALVNYGKFISNSKV